MSPTEKVAATVGAALVAGVLVVGGLVVVVASVALSYESHQCDPPPSGQVRNHKMTERPTCRDGELVVTTPAENMRPDAYGWNCHYDGAGICDTGKLEQHESFCYTDPDDGYTMCQDGRVYHRTSNGGKLDPVRRDPDKNGA